MGVGKDRVTRSNEEKEQGQMKTRGRDRPTPLVLLHSGCCLKSAHSPAGAKRERGREGKEGGGGMEQVVVWGERKVKQSGSRKWWVGEDGGMEREKEGAESSVSLSSCVRTGSAVWLHCSISLPWPSQKQILRSLPPSLPPSLPLPLISPPSFACCHLSSPRSWRPPTFSPSPLSTLLHCPPVHTLSFLLLNLSFLSTLLIPNILLSCHQCNVPFRSAFLLYTASKVTLSRGRCVCG